MVLCGHRKGIQEDQVQVNIVTAVLKRQNLSSARRERGNSGQSQCIVTQFNSLPCPALTQLAMIAASCTPPAPVLILSWMVVMVLEVACCCVPLRLALMLVLTFCTLHPDLCTLCFQWLSLAVTYGGVVSPSAIGTNTPLAHVVVSPIATCAGGVFLPPLTQIPNFRSGNLHCVVFFGGGVVDVCVCGGGGHSASCNIHH